MTRQTDNRAFTLLELLVAVSITLVIAGLMLGITSGMLTLWRRTQASHTQATTAKQVFDLLEQDIQSAVYRRDALHWLAADILDTTAELANHGWLAIGAGPVKPGNGGSLRPLPEPNGNGDRLIQDARFGLSGVWLRFIATNVESGGSLPTLIAYQMVRRPVTGIPVTSNTAPVRYSLYRSPISNTVTFETGYDVTSPLYRSTNNNPNAYTVNQRSVKDVVNPGHAYLLASNVVDFGCWLYVREADGSLRRIFPSDVDDKSHHAIGNSTANDSRYPEVADVMIRILTEEGAMQLEAIEAGRIPVRPPIYASDPEWWWAVVEANSKVFTRRIEVKGGAL
jgi:prepilin-type N-terminal cleavage/methylation domain-containing protein